MSQIRSTRLAVLTWPLILLALIVAFLVYDQRPDYFPSLKVQTHNSVSMSYFHDAPLSESNCQQAIAQIEASVHANCPSCTVAEQACRTALPASTAIFFTETAVSYPVAHMPTGVMVFESPTASLALEACGAAVQSINALNQFKTHASCYPPETKRPYFRPVSTAIDWKNLSYAGLAFFLALLVSKLLTFLVIRYEHLHSHLSHDHTGAGPQKFHAHPTPRIGGIPIMAGLLLCSALLQAIQNKFSDSAFGLLILASLPAFLGGLVEDITKKVGVKERLILTMLSGLFSCWLLDSIIPRFDIPYVDTLLQWTPFAIVVTAFAVGGISNSINIIDGYNGLAAGFGLIASISFASISALQGDYLLVYANLSMSGALIGFLIWNWPGGRIFLGDGGAYLLGFWLAEMGLLLVVRNPSISVWLPLAILIYPTFETLFSIYRRKFKHQSNPGYPDATHLHQLVFKRLVRIHVGSKCASEKTRRNSKVAPYFWIVSTLFCVLSIWQAEQTHALQLICSIFCAGYALFYQRLKTWKVPAALVTRK